MPCGIGEYARSLAHALLSVEPGVEILVFSTREAGGEPYRDGDIVVIPSYDRLAASYSSLLDALAEHGGVDILHLHHEYGIYGDGPAIIEALLEARRERLARRVIATLHTVYHPRGVEGKQARLETQGMASKLDAVVVHSTIQEFELYSQGFSLSRVHRIPHGTSINPYTGQNPYKLLSSLGIEKVDGRIIAVPGFLRPDKGLDTMIEAFSKLSRNGRYTLIVAGEPQGRGADRVEATLARALDRLSGIVLLHRYLSEDQLLRLAAAADILVLPYRDRPGKYSVSGILHLSMGSMKPIIGTRVPRLVELYQYAPRLVVPPSSPDELASKIAWVDHNYDYAVAYMSNVYGYAVRTLWPRMARRHLELYRTLLGAVG